MLTRRTRSAREWEPGLAPRQLWWCGPLSMPHQDFCLPWSPQGLNTSLCAQEVCVGLAGWVRGGHPCTGEQALAEPWAEVLCSFWKLLGSLDACFCTDFL